MKQGTDQDICASLETISLAAVKVAGIGELVQELEGTKFSAVGQILEDVAEDIFRAHDYIEEPCFKEEITTSCEWVIIIR